MYYAWSFSFFFSLFLFSNMTTDKLSRLLLVDATYTQQQ